MSWEKYRDEIDSLLRSYYSDYEERTYLKPVYYVDGIKHDPGLYPMLSGLPVNMQKRYISFFLKEQGRVPRNGNQDGRVWVLPGAAV
jgi:hypothetical protein